MTDAEIIFAIFDRVGESITPRGDFVKEWKIDTGKHVITILYDDGFTWEAYSASTIFQDDPGIWGITGPRIEPKEILQHLASEFPEFTAFLAKPR